MGMTIAEKIIAAAAGAESVKPGDIHTVTLDRLMSNDGTTHLTVDMYRNKLKNPHIADAKTDLWCRQPYLFLWCFRCFWYRRWMYGFPLWNGNWKILGIGS